MRGITVYIEKTERVKVEEFQHCTRNTLNDGIRMEKKLKKEQN